MDPAATLAAAHAAVQAGALQAAREHLNDYQTWRQCGGFEPPNGDATATALRKQLTTKTRTRYANTYR